MFTEKKQTLPMNPQAEQAEKLKEIGLQMRQMREEKSISIDEVATKTRIQARLLVAIEEGNLDHLPEPVYIRGLIKQFAEVLGLNGTEYASAFPTGQQTNVIKPSWRQLPAAQLRPLHLYVIYILLVIASVSGLSYIIEQRSSQEATNNQNVTEEVIPEPNPSNTEPQLATTSTSSPEKPDQSAQTSPVEVKVSLKQDSWVRVVSDGKTLYEGVLSAGEKQSWTAQQELTLRAGNAGGVVVEYNQQAPTSLGASGEVKTVTYSPEN